MATWNELADADPDLAAAGLRLLERTGTGEGLLATVRQDAPPRIHPVAVAVIDGHLVTWVIAASAKAADLRQDGRYALHAHQDPAAPNEFQVRGRAAAVPPGGLRNAAMHWSFEVDEGFVLYELDIEHAVLGERPDAAAWPPIYSSWRSSHHG